MVEKAKRDWLPITITVGSSLFTGILTGVIAVMTMKGDIRVLGKDLETSSKASETRFVNIEKELGEMRNLHYRMAVKQQEQDRNIKGVTNAVNPMLLASKTSPISLPPSKVQIDIPTQTAVIDVKKKIQR